MNLIHVTNVDKLESILENGLMTSLSKEDYFFINDNNLYRVSYSVQMISFFGMSLNEHLMYQQSYGSVGLVLSDKISKLNNVSPVRYLNVNSILNQRFYKIYNERDVLRWRFILEDSESIIGFYKETLTSLKENFIFSKPFKSNLYRKNEVGEYVLTAEDYIFGLEREWRYVPNIFIQKGFRLSIDDEELLKEEYIEYLKIDHYLNGIIVSSLREKSIVNSILKNKFPDRKINVILRFGYGKKTNSKFKKKLYSLLNLFFNKLNTY